MVPTRYFLHQPGEVKERTDGSLLTNYLTSFLHFWATVVHRMCLESMLLRWGRGAINWTVVSSLRWCVPSFRSFRWQKSRSKARIGLPNRAALHRAGSLFWFFLRLCRLAFQQLQLRRLNTRIQMITGHFESSPRNNESLLLRRSAVRVIFMSLWRHSCKSHTAAEQNESRIKKFASSFFHRRYALAAPGVALPRHVLVSHVCQAGNGRRERFGASLSQLEQQQTF